MSAQLLYLCAMDNLYKPFEIQFTELMEQCPRPQHKHSFFELVFIVKGTGVHKVNEAGLPYHEGQLFLLAPEDAHGFKIKEPTRFCFIRFTNIYIKSPGLHVERLEFILKNANNIPSCVLKNVADRIIVKSIIEAIIREHENHDLYNQELIQQYVNTLIMIVARNIALGLPEQMNEKSEEKALDILQYIQTNIYEPEKLRADAISKEFGIAEAYLGKYFKKHTTETMQQYITNYKLKMIENRLLHGNMRIAEIADELGFTDKSHLIRIFRKYRGMSPTEYKKNSQ
jgi:AraC family transcriptional regulator, L-rhamnose operon transcriptional activator RhaR